MNRILFLILCTFSPHWLCQVSAEEVSQYQKDAMAAQAYADAYATQNTEGLMPYLAEAAIFHDPSNHYEGKDAIISGFKAGFARGMRTGPDGQEIFKFRSGQDFVFSALLDFYMMMAPGGGDPEEFRFKVNFVMVLTIEDGLVVKHVDYVDTEAFMAQMQAQMEAQMEGSQ